MSIAEYLRNCLYIVSEVFAVAGYDISFPGKRVVFRSDERNVRQGCRRHCRVPYGVSYETWWIVCRF